MVGTDEALEEIDGDRQITGRERFVGLGSDAERARTESRKGRNAGRVRMGRVCATRHYGENRLTTQNLAPGGFRSVQQPHVVHRLPWRDPIRWWEPRLDRDPVEETRLGYNIA